MRSANKTSRPPWIVCLLLPLLFTVAAANVSSYSKQGEEHFYNLEYNQAIADFERHRAQNPDDPHVYNDIAAAYLFRELNRFGMARSSAFKKGNSFLNWERLDVRPGTEKKFRQYLYYGRHLGETTLESDPKNRDALYAVSQSYALEANYDFVIDKSYFSALRHANKAHKISKRLIRHHPGFVDGYFVAGMQEYILGSLPWYVKVVVALGGVGGDREKGVEYVQKVAEEGERARNQSRAILALFLRREDRPLDAAKVLEGMMQDFPRNYVLPMEIGSVYLDTDEKQKALTTLRSAWRKVQQDQSSFGRMPDIYRKQLKEQLADVEEQIAE